MEWLNEPDWGRLGDPGGEVGDAWGEMGVGEWEEWGELDPVDMYGHEEPLLVPFECPLVAIYTICQRKEVERS